MQGTQYAVGDFVVRIGSVAQSGRVQSSVVVEVRACLRLLFGWWLVRYLFTNTHRMCAGILSRLLGPGAGGHRAARVPGEPGVDDAIPGQPHTVSPFVLFAIADDLIGLLVGCARRVPAWRYSSAIRCSSRSCLPAMRCLPCTHFATRPYSMQ